MIFLFQSAVDHGRDCPKDLWLWHGLWYPDAHDKQQGECSMDGSWGLWRWACEKHYIYVFFWGGGTHDANFAKLKVNLYCFLYLHMSIYGNFKTLIAHKILRYENDCKNSLLSNWKKKWDTVYRFFIIAKCII